jgi:hypothetical protein
MLAQRSTRIEFSTQFKVSDVAASGANDSSPHGEELRACAS